METLRTPWWYSPDVFFDLTGETQRGWAREGAARYRAAHPERYGKGDTPSVTPSKSVTASHRSVTKSVTSGKKSVTSVTPERHSVTESVTESVTSKKDKTAERTRRWREKQRTAPE